MCASFEAIQVKVQQANGLLAQSSQTPFSLTQSSLTHTYSALTSTLQPLLSPHYSPLITLHSLLCTHCSSLMLSAICVLQVKPCGVRLAERSEHYTIAEVAAAKQVVRRMIKRYRWRQAISGAQMQSASPLRQPDSPIGQSASRLSHEHSQSSQPAMPPGAEEPAEETPRLHACWTAYPARPSGKVETPHKSSKAVTLPRGGFSPKKPSPRHRMIDESVVPRAGPPPSPGFVAGRREGRVGLTPPS